MTKAVRNPQSTTVNIWSHNDLFSTSWISKSPSASVTFCSTHCERVQEAVCVTSLLRWAVRHRQRAPRSSRVYRCCTL